MKKSKREALYDLQWALDGTEPCRQNFDEDGNVNDPEKWTGNWVNSTTPEIAEELCKGCHVLDKYLIYALIAKEKDFIWGGKTPEQRREILNGTRRQRTKEVGSGPTNNQVGAD